MAETLAQQFGLSGLADTDASVDATSSLADAIVTASGSMSEDGVKALVFLGFYSPALYAHVRPQLDILKLRQSPGAVRRMMEALQAVALNKLWDRVNLKPGS